LPPCRSQANHSFKPALSYGWDWHPGLIPSGIWDDTYLEVRNNGYIEEMNYSYELDQKLENPVLYDFVLEVTGNNNTLTDRKTWISKFRKVQLVENRGAIAPDYLFPKSRNEPPFTLEINNIRIFAKGTNWVNPEIFPGIITYERYRELCVPGNSELNSEYMLLLK
jgi:beta-mannosidase